MHISSPISESWVYWILLLFFVLVAINRSVRDSVVVAMRNSFSHSERVYGGQSQNILAISTAWIFRIGVLALAIYVLSYTSEQFTFMAYTKILGAVALIEVIRHILLLGVGWVFLSNNQLANGIGQLEIVRNVVCVLLLPVLLLLIRLNYPMLHFILLGIIGLAFTVLVIAKSTLLFYKNILSIFYILLYFIYLEIIPVAGMVLWTKHILQ